MRDLSEGLLSQFNPKGVAMIPSWDDDDFFELGIALGAVQSKSLSLPLSELPGLESVSNDVSKLPLLPTVPVPYLRIHPYSTVDLTAQGIPPISIGSSGVGSWNVGLSWAYLEQFTFGLPIKAGVKLNYFNSKIEKLPDISVTETGFSLMQTVGKSFGKLGLVAGFGFVQGTLGLKASASKFALSETPKSLGTLFSLGSFYQWGAFRTGLEWNWIGSVSSGALKLGFSL